MNPSLLFFVLFFGAVLTQTTQTKTFEYVGGVFFPDAYNPERGVSWFNTCELQSKEQFPVYLMFTVVVDLPLSNPHISFPITSATMKFGNPDSNNALSLTSGWILQEGTAHFTYENLSGFTITAYNGNPAGVEVHIETFLWSMKEISAFADTFASGYFFSGCSNFATPTTDSCFKDPCSVDCNVGGTNNENNSCPGSFYD